MNGDVLERLRVATRSDHANLDAGLDIFSALADPASRLALTCRFHQLYAGAEEVLGDWLGDVPGLDYTDRLRTPLILRDLADQGAEPPRDCPAMRQPASRAEALGHLYVLEGSTLGGQMISRQLAKAGRAGEKLRLLDPYGQDTGLRWKAFLSVLQRDCPPHRPDLMEAAVQGGVDGFRRAGLLLTAQHSSSLQSVA